MNENQQIMTRTTKMPQKSSMKASEYGPYGAPSTRESYYEQKYQNGGGVSANYQNHDFESKSSIMRGEPSRNVFASAPSGYTESIDPRQRASKSMNYRNTEYDQDPYTDDMDNEEGYYDENDYESQCYSRAESPYSSQTMVERPGKPRSLTYYTPFLAVPSVRRDYY